MPSPSSTKHIGYNQSFERRWAKTQRGLWIFLTCLILAAFVGLFGKGPLTRKRLVAPGLEVEYERIARHQAPGQISFRFQPGVGTSAAVTLKMPGNLLEVYQVRTITPLPARQMPNAEGILYEFNMPENSGGRIVLDVVPTHMGALEAEVSAGSHRLTLPIVILP